MLDPRVRLAGHGYGNHLEVHHVVAWRSSVALVAIHRVSGWMAELGNVPSVGRMAGRTVHAEERSMPVLIAVAGETIERRFLRRKARVEANGIESAISLFR